MAESVEYSALLECFDSLVTALKFDPASLSDELATKGLVPPGEVTQRRTSAEQARELAGKILDRVKLSPIRYHDVVKILSRHLWMEDFIHILQSAHSELPKSDSPKAGKEDESSRNHVDHTETEKLLKAEELVSQPVCVSSSLNGDQSNDSQVKDFKCDLGEISYHESSIAVPNPIVNFSSLDEDDLEDLHAQMSELTKKIDLEFQSFFSKVFASFRDSDKIDRDKLVLTLTRYETIFEEDELAKTKTVFDVFMLIKRSCSYFNYEALQTLVQVEGSDKDNRYLEEYIQAFSEYCRAMPCAEEICGGENAKLKRTKLKFKLDFDRARLKPDAIQSIKHNIARCLGIRPSSLYLSRVKDGCISLEFLVPTFIAKDLFPLSNAQMVTLYTEIKVLIIENSSLHLDIKGDALCLLYGSMLLENEKDVVDPSAQMPKRPKNFEIPLAALTSNTSNQTQTAKSSVSDSGSFSSPQLALTHNFKDCQITGCFCSLAVQLEQYAAHTSPGVESARNMTPGSCFSANSQQTESGYCGSIPLLSRSNSMLPSPIQSKSSDNHYQIPDHQQPIPQDQPPHITSCEIPQQQLVDPLSSSSAPLLPQYPSGGDTVYPQRTTSQPIQPACLEQSHSMIFSHSDHSDISSDHQSPASTHGQYVQHPSPHMQPVPGYQARQSQFISQSDLAAVQRALMHNRHCQIPGCCCQRVRELVEGSRGRMLYDSPEMSIASSGSGNSNRIHRVSHQVSSTDSDSDYSSYTDKRSRPPNLRLLSDEHNRNPNLHPHYHLTTKSHMRRVSVHAPVDHRRSRSLSDLTPLIEVPETPATTPPIGGSIKPGTPVYYQQLQPALGEDATEQFVKDDCSPMLLREISISSDNIPALCLNDCPFTPSPLKESCRMLAATPGRRKGSFRRASMQSTKPKLKTVKDNVPNEAEEEESSSSETEANQNISSDPVPPTTNPDPHMQCIGSSSQISMHSRASALQFETEI